jgi:hypothetical protein
MKKEERNQLLQDLAKTNFGRALEELLNEELAKIDTVDNITTLEEAIGRQKAKQVIEAVFSFMGRANPQSTLHKQTYT